MRLTRAANQYQVRLLRAGVERWNRWRKNKKRTPNLMNLQMPFAYLPGVDLRRAHLGRAFMSASDLREADLERTYLTESEMHDVDFSDANLRHANLSFSMFSGSNFEGADLAGADLHLSNLDGTNFDHASLAHANLHGCSFASATFDAADFSGAVLGRTVFSDVDLSQATGLDRCIHSSASILDHKTLQKSGPLPLVFLRGVGLPETLIEYLPALFERAIVFYSCFISYASVDEEFARALHADLQDRGVRCWFAPHDMPIGSKIWDEIDSAIRLRDKVLLILSEHSIKSDWVEDEVTKAFEEERKRQQIVLFPIRLDDAVMDANESWAGKLRARHIGDFRRWKEHDEYQKNFARVLRDLAVKKDWRV